MNFWYWIPIFLFVIILFYLDKRKAKQRRILSLIRNKHKGGVKIMNNSFEKFVGKDCIITTMNGTIKGVVESIEDSWIVIRTNDSVTDTIDMVSVDYISRIREHPVNKRGKKKSIIFEDI
jgi:hypothetical protein